MNQHTIYYFSGTGNSFTVAKDLADKLDADLISIPSLVNKDNIHNHSEIIGFVFPDYHSDIPNIVKGFIKKIDSLKNSYVFGVCTYGGKGPGLTMKYLKKAVEEKHGYLSAGFAVHMPYNYIIPLFSLKKLGFKVKLKKISKEEQEQMFSSWRKKRDEILAFVKKRKMGLYESSGELILKLVDSFKLKETLGKYIWLKIAGVKKHTKNSFSESRKLMDTAFYATDQCIECKTCEKICPVNNIKFVHEKPNWFHHCEQCFACLQYCPTEAIQFGLYTMNNPRYHHPDVDACNLIFKK